jgi:DNA-directed RNA polymerases I and III subunit RPAC2
MSVNEVKLKKAPVAFAIKGTGPATARTFCIGNEDHTLGNVVRHVLIQNHQVEFAGYSVPHPADPVVQIRVQTLTPQVTAAAALKQACQTVYDQCDFVLAKLEQVLPDVKEDRIRMENYLIEQEADEEEDPNETMQDTEQAMEE